MCQGFKNRAVAIDCTLNVELPLIVRNAGDSHQKVPLWKVAGSLVSPLDYADAVAVQVVVETQAVYLVEGVELAARSIDHGRAIAKLDELVELSQSLE